MELHLASHYPNTITTKDGKHLEEPPAIEGYVHAYKRKTQARVQYYLSTHDGFLFAVQVEKVVTPPTPTDLKSFAKSEEEFREDEQIRLRTQIINARWFWDIRNVLQVRRAMHPTHQIRDLSITANEVMQPADPDADVLAQAQEPHYGGVELHRTESDIGDEGGDATLARSADKPRLKMHRSFEVVLKNGRILRFEVSSCVFTNYRLMKICPVDTFDEGRRGMGDSSASFGSILGGALSPGHRKRDEHQGESRRRENNRQQAEL